MANPFKEREMQKRAVKEAPVAHVSEIPETSINEPALTTVSESIDTSISEVATTTVQETLKTSVKETPATQVAPLISVKEQHAALAEELPEPPAREFSEALAEEETGIQLEKEPPAERKTLSVARPRKTQPVARKAQVSATRRARSAEPIATKPRYEKKTVVFSILVTEGLRDRLDDALDSGQWRSRNDLIFYLLDEGLQNLEAGL